MWLQNNVLAGCQFLLGFSEFGPVWTSWHTVGTLNGGTGTWGDLKLDLCEGPPVSGPSLIQSGSLASVPIAETRRSGETRFDVFTGK